jgi:hypothetical protein
VRVQGGTRYATSSSTIARFPDSMLYTLVFGSMNTTRDDKVRLYIFSTAVPYIYNKKTKQNKTKKQKRYFIDRDGYSFRHVLNFMRSGRLSLPMNFDEYEALLVRTCFGCSFTDSIRYSILLKFRCVCSGMPSSIKLIEIFF